MIARPGTALASNRVPTGIGGLDPLIQGGFPVGSVNLVAGPAGSGKSLLLLVRLGDLSRFIVIKVP